VIDLIWLAIVLGLTVLSLIYVRVLGPGIGGHQAWVCNSGWARSPRFSFSFISSRFWRGRSAS